MQVETDLLKQPPLISICFAFVAHAVGEDSSDMSKNYITRTLVATWT